RDDTTPCRRIVPPRRVGRTGRRRRPAAWASPPCRTARRPRRCRSPGWPRACRSPERAGPASGPGSGSRGRVTPRASSVGLHSAVIRGFVDGVEQRTASVRARQVTGGDELRQRLVHPSQVADAGGKVGAPTFGQGPGRIATLRPPAVEMEEFVHLVKGEPELLSSLDEPDQPDHRDRVLAIPTGGTWRRGQQATPLVV